MYYYFYEKQNIFLLENRNTTIYTGKWRYCYLCWKTEIFLFTVEHRNIVYTGKKDVFISLLENTHFPVYTGKRIHRNSYVPSNCINRWAYWYITTFQKVSQANEEHRVYIYIYIYIYIMRIIVRVIRSLFEFDLFLIVATILFFLDWLSEHRCSW